MCIRGCVPPDSGALPVSHVFVLHAPTCVLKVLLRRSSSRCPPVITAERTRKPAWLKARTTRATCCASSEQHTHNTIQHNTPHISLHRGRGHTDIVRST